MSHSLCPFVPAGAVLLREWPSREKCPVDQGGHGIHGVPAGQIRRGGGEEQSCPCISTFRQLLLFQAADMLKDSAAKCLQEGWYALALPTLILHVRRYERKLV